jgi:hypothetical protein
VHAVDRDLGGVQPGGEFETRHDLGEFAPTVGAHTTVIALDHAVVEVDRVLAERGDIDDAGRRRATRQGAVRG